MVVRLVVCALCTHGKGDKRDSPSYPSHQLGAVAKSEVET